MHFEPRPCVTTQARAQAGTGEEEMQQRKLERRGWRWLIQALLPCRPIVAHPTGPLPFPWGFLWSLLLPRVTSRKTSLFTNHPCPFQPSCRAKLAMTGPRRPVSTRLRHPALECCDNRQQGATLRRQSQESIPFFSKASLP